MKTLTPIVAGLFLLSLISGCVGGNPTILPEPTNTIALSQTPTPTETPKPTNTPLPTQTVTTTNTVVPTKTARPTKTPIPIVYVTLGSPFPTDCGDGIPRIWSNDSFNGIFDLSRADDNHGHVDIFPPAGCEVGKISGEFVASADGYGEMYGNGLGYHLTLPGGVFPLGFENALKFSGIESPTLRKITKITLDFGHVFVPTTGYVQKGDSIGELVELPSWVSHRYKIAYQVSIVYGGIEYFLSPTLFQQDGPEWVCVLNSPYDCFPESNDYAP